MIARDEARCIGRALASVRGVVDRLLVLDTGSRDATAALAAQAGADVSHFAWIDDFAAARNAALARADADWCLVLDADEWLQRPPGGADPLAALRHGRADFIGQLRVDSVFEAAGGPAGNDLGGSGNSGNSGGGGMLQHAPSWLPRLLPRGVRYAGRIHEQPLSELPRRRLPQLVIGHDGYLPAQQAAKQGRNQRLLQLALQASPADAYLRYQLGKDFDVQQRHADAAAEYLQADARADRCAAWRHDLVVRLLFALKATCRFAEAVQFAEREMAHWPHSPDFFFALGDLLLGWAAAEPQRAAELLPMIESSWLRAIQIGEQPALHDSVSGRGSFLAAHNLAVFHEALGDAAAAAPWRARAQAMRQRRA